MMTTSFSFGGVTVVCLDNRARNETSSLCILSHVTARYVYAEMESIFFVGKVEKSSCVFIIIC